MPSILFVCLGNICRSPAAEAIMQKMVNQSQMQPHFRLESCGLGGWHVGELPDTRMRKALSQRGIESNSRAMQFKPQFFDHFDLILAADGDVLHSLLRMATTEQDRKKTHLMTKFSKTYENQDIPDPYYGNDDSFEEVLDMLETVCEQMLSVLRGY